MKIKPIIMIFLSAVVTVFLASCDVPSATTSLTDEPATSISQSTFEKIDVNVNVVNSVSQLPGDTGSGAVDQLADNFKSVIKIIEKTVVYVTAVGKETVFSGSGVVIAASDPAIVPVSYVVTCHHLIASAESVTVTAYNGETYAATFIGSDPDSDLCVMSVNAALPTATVYSGADDSPETGEDVVAVGYPYGSIGKSFTTGIISGVFDDVKTGGKKLSLLQTDAVVSEGSSGGGLFTRSGYLVGIIDAKINDEVGKNVNSLNFAVPSKVMLDVAASLMDTYTGTSPGYIKGKYNLGFTVNNYYVGLWTSKAYVYIVALDETGCLFKAGLKVNDRVDSVEYKGETYLVTDAEQFTDYINDIEFDIGDEIVFKLTRGETPYTITVSVLQYIFGMS